MATIIGTPNSETLTGTEFADSILGAGGNDVVNGLAGADTLDGGTDNDTVRGGDGNDSLFGSGGKDRLFGDAGDDRLFGGERVDRLTGGDGNDVLDGGNGDDSLAGGLGNDVYIVDSLADTTVESFFAGTDEVRTALLSLSLAANIENLTFTGTGDFVGVGNSGENRISGKAGNDMLDGASGNDRLLGSSGRDTIVGGEGDDALDGGTGRDKLSGGAGNDTMLGGDFNDTLQGGAGTDVLDGGAGTDTAVFAGLKSDYEIQRIGDRVEVVDLNPGDGDDGADLLSGVEILQFKDGQVSPPTIVAAIDLASLDGTNGFTFRGLNNDDYSGWSVSDAGDVNGDGFDDVIVGSPDYTFQGVVGDSGRSYVIFGKANWADTPLIGPADLDGTNGFRLTAPEPNGRIGYSVSSAGDINGDGFADLIIGAPGQYQPYEAGDKDGQAFVVFGRANWENVDLFSLDGSDGFQLRGPSDYGLAGFSVSSAGDVNGDGLDDLIIGAPKESTLAGTSYVVFGKADWTGTPQLDLGSLNGTNGFQLLGVDIRDYTGWSVSSAGDINGDGLDDVVVAGVHFAGYPPKPPAEAYVVFGKADWSGTPALDLETLDGKNGFRVTGQTDGEVGQSVHAAGDVNGDGLADMIVSASSDDHVGHVIFGKADWTGTPALDVATLDGSNGFTMSRANTFGGVSVSSAGDVNGDGYGDLIVGARFNKTATGDFLEGESYVVYGKADWSGVLDLADLDGTNGFRLVGADTGDLSGFSVSSAGDVNNDGFDDLIVGAPFAEVSDSRLGQGESYVVFGGNFNNATVQLSAHARPLEQELIIGSG
jgi:hypothetical protein